MLHKLSQMVYTNIYILNLGSMLLIVDLGESIKQDVQTSNCWPKIYKNIEYIPSLNVEYTYTTIYNSRTSWAFLLLVVALAARLQSATGKNSNRFFFSFPVSFFMFLRYWNFFFNFTHLFSLLYNPTYISQRIAALLAIATIMVSALPAKLLTK